MNQTAGTHLTDNPASGMMRLSSSWWTRRTRFQLTPLMDLLLIIVFAQFLDVRETAEQQSSELAQRQDRLTAEIERKRADVEMIRQSLSLQSNEIIRQRDQARAQRDQALQQRDASIAQSKNTLALVNEFFRLSDSDWSPTTQGASEAKREAEQQSRQLVQADPNALTRFLVGHAELLKRAEIWTVHAKKDRSIVLQAGETEDSFRLEAKTQIARTREVEDQFFAAYKRLPQPKGLVVILVSYDPSSVAGVYQPLVDALPQALERLRADTPDSRFEYTVLGASKLDPSTVIRPTSPTGS